VRAGPAQRLGVPVTAFLGAVVVAAGTTGIVLLAAPGSTDRYFSWTLRPASAAALVGGFYLASAAAFGWALTLRWSEVRSLVVGVLGLTVPTLVLTSVHDEVFDFGRWQAIAWVLLFVAAPGSALALLVARPPEAGSDRRLHPATRAALGLLAVAFLAVATLVWLDATRDEVERSAPVALVGLTGTYLGAWCAFLGVLCGAAAVRNRGDAARLPLVTLGLAAAGVVAGLLRTAGDVRHLPAALAVAGAVLALAVGLSFVERPR
jgi:hypothetical protein